MDNKSNLYIVAIVGIVAVVAIVMMITNTSQKTLSVASMDDSVGQAFAKTIDGSVNCRQFTSESTCMAQDNCWWKKNTNSGNSFCDTW